MFRVDPSKVSSAGVRARCSVCGGVITIGAGTSIDEEFDNATVASRETPIRAPEVIEAHRPPSAPAARAPVIGESKSPTPMASQTPVAVDSQAVEATLISQEVAAPLMPPVRAGAPQASATPTPSAAVNAQTPTAPQPAGIRPPPFARAPLTPPASVPGVHRPAAGLSGLPPVPPARSPLSARPSGVGPVAAIRPSAAPAAPTAAPPGPASRAEPAALAGTSSPKPARTPINPFLANDPNAKARRLSRALVSDLVTYFPQRRDEGLRDGTLKALFSEEIKKSYEEYVEQVGRDVADSTTHFKDALNEILASGRTVF
jgi:hypothetical protein